MSKYEVVRLFDIMKTYIFLIILFDFSHSVLCMQYCNASESDLYPLCPYKFIRRKRAPVDYYTRWGPLTKPSTEFIVKVVDEEETVSSTPRTNVPGIIGVNYEPEVQNFGKRIVGGAAVMPPRPVEALPKVAEEDPVGPLDYTRFGEPSRTVSKADIANLLSTKTPAVSSVYSPPHLASNMFRPRIKDRDESPPAIPHFIPHNQELMTSINPLVNVVPVPFTRHTHTLPPPTSKRPAWYLQYTTEPPTTTVQQTSHTALLTTSKPKPITEQPPRTSTLEVIHFLRRTKSRAEITTSINVRKERNKPIRTTPETVEFLPVKDFAFQTINEEDDLRRQATVLDNQIPIAKANSAKETDFYVFDADYDNYPISDPKGKEGGAKNVDDDSRNQRQIEDDIKNMDKVVALNNEEKSEDEYDEPVTKMATEKLMHNYYLNESVTQDDEVDLIFKTRKTTLFRPRSYLTTRTTRTTPPPRAELIEETTQPTTIQINYKLEPNGSITITQNLKLFKTVCSLIKLRPLSFTRAITLPEVIDTMKKWADSSPLAQLIDITEGNYTAMENSIYMMMVDDPSHGQAISAKDTVMIIAGIQGRDHHAVLSAMYVLYQLIERSDSHNDILSRYRFWVIPVFNPDGYDYSMSFPAHRQWKKNLRQRWETCDGKTDRNKLTSCKLCESVGIRCFVQPCYGVNLDRNFEYQWIPPNELQTEYPCGDLFPGPQQLSEVETYALTNFLHQQSIKLHTFLALKEGDVLGVMYPYSHTKKKRMFNHVYRQRAAAAARAAFGINGRQYVAGQTSEFLPLYAGGIEDWFDGHLGIDHTYAIVMSQPHYVKVQKEGFLESVAHETFAALDTLLLQKVSEPNALPKVSLTQDTRRNLGFRYTRSHLKIICSVICIGVLS